MTMKRKIFPRISTQLSAVVTNAEGIHLKIVALDTTQYGFSFQCSTLQRNSLTPGGCLIHNGRLVEFDVFLELPFPDEYLQIKARCHVAFSRRIANDKCEIGIRYEEFEGDGYTYLIKFMETKSTTASISMMRAKPLISPVQMFV
jgi:hypothetical protein